jgi:uncharacterized membrane protein
MTLVNDVRVAYAKALSSLRECEVKIIDAGVDWLGAVLCKVGRRELRAPRWCGDDGELRVQGDPITFAGMLDAAFDQIRQNAQAHPAVSIRLLEVLGTIAEQFAM